MNKEIEIVHNGFVYRCDYVEYKQEAITPDNYYCALRDEDCDIGDCMHWQRLRKLEEML